jgi:predicted ATPase/DNA-binding CsgD family transcriptional regulator
VTTANPLGVSRREIEVLALVGARLSNADIAGRLHLSVRTVENHVSSLLRKYGVADRRALAEVAAQVAVGVAEPGRLAGAPATLTRFIGRDFERTLLLGALRDGRLVTLHGPGGVGKTRLAVEVARAAGSLFPSGRMFIDLIPVREGYVAQALAAALGVSERPRESLEEAIVARIGDGRFLLILDNCEHVIDAAAGFAERLLSVSPGVRILATSRERLGIRGERTVRLGPLPLGSDAEILFGDRASLADPEFAADPAAVAEICARLDGLPLAIELAAARISALGVGGVLAGLGDSLRLLAGGRGTDERHHSLRAVIGWSYDLLDDEERGFFRHLAVFAGAFALDAASAVTLAGGRGTAADLLGRLVDKSLLVHQRATPDRWRLLETVRAFAAERLRADGEEAQARERHRAWFAAYAAELERRIGGQWRDEFDVVACDLRAALAGCPPGPDPVAHGLARALGHLTFARRFLKEALGHYEQAAVRAPSPSIAARDLADAAGCALLLNFSPDRAFELLFAAADQACRAGDGNAQAIALARAVEIAARHTGSYPPTMQDERLKDALQHAASAGDPAHPLVAAALAAAEVWSTAPVKFKLDPNLARIAEQTARAAADPVLISASLDATRTAATAAGRLRDAYRISTERVSLLASMDQNSPRAAAEIADTYNMVCTDAIGVGDLPAALAFADLGREDDPPGSHPYQSMSTLIPTLALMGRLAEATREAARMWAAWQRADRPAAGPVSPALAAAAMAHCLLGHDGAFRLWRARADEAAGITAADPSRHLSFAAFVDARCAAHVGELTRAEELASRAFSDPSQGWYAAYAQAAAAELAVIANLPAAAQHLAAAAPAAQQNAWAAACLDRTAGRLRDDPSALASAITGWERIGARFERACTLLLLPQRAGEGHAELQRLGVPSGQDPPSPLRRE